MTRSEYRQIVIDAMRAVPDHGFWQDWNNWSDTDQFIFGMDDGYKDPHFIGMLRGVTMMLMGKGHVTIEPFGDNESYIKVTITKRTHN